PSGLDAAAPAGRDAGGLEVLTEGLYVTDVPVLSEKPIEGDILVHLEDKPRDDAVVKINGTVIPHAAPVAGIARPGMYDVGAAGLTGIGAKTKVTLEARVGGKTSTVSFTCPPEVAITSPAANSGARQGDNLAVTWTGTLEAKTQFGPVVGVYACFTEATGNTVTALGHGSDFIHLVPGDTSATVPVKSVCARYLLELRAVGAQEFSAGSGGVCYLQRRIWLKGP
ncbi:MAG: hypothetical protein HY901_10855, partial [Deltaproteobacteria bacterium]|nr:hypothetical protein [Deltaproteobacteria bacterium]